MMTAKERKDWLNGRKLHGIVNNSPACRSDMSLAAGYCFHCGDNDLRHITCKTCRKVLKSIRKRVS